MAKAKKKKNNRVFGVFDQPRSKIGKQVTNEIESIGYFLANVLLVCITVAVLMTIAGLILIAL